MAKLVLDNHVMFVYMILLINCRLQIMDTQGLKTFLPIQKDTEFPLENIPFGVVSRKNDLQHKFIATRVGDWILNLKQIQNRGIFNGPLFSSLGRKVFQGDSLNQFMSLQRSYWKQARKTIQQLLGQQSEAKNNEQLKFYVLFKEEDVVNHLPAKIGDYTDFYSSRAHAFNVGSIIRGPANALNQNWLHIPIGYHGRASSIVVSGTPLRRPRGQVKAKDATQPSFSDCKRLDFQVQIGAFIGGTVNQLGTPIKVSDAWKNIFGFVILNDWSFRDFQTWQYVPLGPFTAKNGMSTISPWIVTLQALQGSQVKLQPQQPQPLPYLKQPNHISYDINLSVGFKTKQMEKVDEIVKTNYKYMYWSCAQQLAHHSVSGCNMKPGDMLGSGTISGPEKHQFGSLLQLTWGGQNSISLSSNQTRKFIQDGDSINIRGYALRNGIKIGFGNCQGTVLPALEQSVYY